MFAQQGKRVFRSVVLLWCAALTTCSQPKTITILHTNDMHASYIPHQATWRRESPKPMVGGFQELEFTVDSIRKVKPNVLLLDAGDVMTGNPITDRVYKGAEGGALFEMMNMIGYDAWCLGNHDFDISQENLRALTTIARFPTLSANVVNTKNEFPLHNKDYIIVERGGVKIGIIGIMTQQLYGLVFQDNLVGIKVLSPIETVQKIIDRIDGETDLIIALTHQGVDDDSTMAAQVHGLDIIVGGHSHTRLTKPKIVNDVIIVQTGSRCENLGELEVTVENDKVAKYDGKLIPLWPNDSHPRTRLAEFADSLQKEINKEYDEVIAQLTVDWKKDGRAESNLGQFLADAQREAAHAQVGFMNGGGIRANAAAGPLTKRALFEILPFRNILTTFQLSGKELKDVVLKSVNGEEAIILSGITAKLQRHPDGSVSVVSMSVDGKPVNEKRMYVCAASDFFVGQAKRYIGVEIPQPVYLKQTVFQAVEGVVRKAKVIATKSERRIEIVQ